MRTRTPVEEYTRDGVTYTRHPRVRYCNGCEQPLGDATPDEQAAEEAGNPLPDVRGECPTCTPHGQTPEGDESRD